MKALPSKSWNRGLSWCAFAVSLLSMFACLCGAVFHLARAYIRTSVSTFPDEWPSFWAALFSFAFSVFSLAVCYAEVRRLSMKAVVISWKSRALLFGFVFVMFVLTFISLISYLVTEDIQTTLWILMGFTPVSVLMALEIDITHRSYKMLKSPQYTDYLFTDIDPSWGRIPVSPYAQYDTDASDSSSTSGHTTDSDISLSTPSVVMPTDRHKKQKLLKGLRRCLGALAMAVVTLAYVMFTVNSVVHASKYRIMLNPPGKKFLVPFSNTSERTVRLHINCIGVPSKQYPYTLVLDHDQGVPSPLMFIIQDYIIKNVRNIGAQPNYNGENNNSSNINTISTSSSITSPSTMRVCTYDRGGYGWSERGRNIVLVSEKAQQLVALLQAANEKGPYVLGAHGHGGLVMTEAIKLLPQDAVAGIVLINSYAFGNIRKKIDLALGKSYTKDVRNIISLADVNRAFSPMGVSWIKASKTIGTIEKFITTGLKIKNNPSILLRDAIEWSEERSSFLDSSYWDILEYYKKDSVNNEEVRKKKKNYKHTYTKIYIPYFHHSNRTLEENTSSHLNTFTRGREQCHL